MNAAVLHIIIPTRNAANSLPDLLKDIPSADGLRVIVADGGSTDGTLRVAARFGAILATGACGRGPQLALGAHLAVLSGEADDWFLFLHADSRLPRDWWRIVQRAMQNPYPRYFRFKANARGVRARLMEALVNFRAAGWGLPYGDQGLLIRRADYERIGGYKPMALFEDVDIVQRLDNLRPLPLALTTDVSAYERDGYWARGRRNLALLKRFRHGESVDTLHSDYCDEA